MKYLLLFALPLAVVCACTSEPELIVSPDILDLGKIPAGHRAEGIFSLKNSGGAVLVIDSVSTSCGCLAVDVDRRLEPGKSADLRIQFEGVNAEQPFQGSVFISSNDPKDPRRTLSVKGETVSVVNADPACVYFGAANWNDERVEKDVIISRGRLSTLETLENMEVFSSSSYVKTSMRNVGDKVYISIKLSELTPTGLLNEAVTVKLIEPKDYMKVIPIVAELKGEHAATPAKIILRISKGLSKTFCINRVDTDEQISLVSCKPRTGSGTIKVRRVREEKESVTFTVHAANSLSGFCEFTALFSICSPIRREVEYLQVPIFVIE